MTAVDYAGIENKKNELIRKGLRGSVFIAPITATAITNVNLFDATTGGLAVLPSGYQDLGWTSTAGAVLGRKVTGTDIAAWGTNDPVRSDITADVSTMKVDGYETKLLTISLSSGVAQASITPATNGSVQVNLPSSPTATFYRVLALAVDDGTAGEIVVARFFPRAQITDYTDTSFANDKDPLVNGYVFTGYQDSTVGFAQAMLFGGEGWEGILSDMGFSRVVTCTVATSTALVATAGIFEPDDVGAMVSGVGLVGGQTIVSLTDSTHATLSAAGTVAGSGVAVTIHGDN